MEHTTKVANVSAASASVWFSVVMDAASTLIRADASAVDGKVNPHQIRPNVSGIILRHRLMSTMAKKICETFAKNANGIPA